MTLPPDAPARRRFGATGALAVTVAIAIAAFFVHQKTSPPTRASTEDGAPMRAATAAARAHPAKRARTSASEGLRPAIREKIARDLPALQTRPDVDGYLASLEAAARTRGQVTALEVEPGIRAIREGYAEDAPERARAFSDRMLRLAGELEHRPAPPDPPDIDDVFARLEEAEEGPERTELVRAYLHAVDEADPEDRDALLGRLRQQHVRQNADERPRPPAH